MDNGEDSAAAYHARDGSVFRRNAASRRKSNRLRLGLRLRRECGGGLSGPVVTQPAQATHQLGIVVVVEAVRGSLESDRRGDSCDGGRLSQRSRGPDVDG